MDVEIIRPTDKESKFEYVIIFRFNNYENLTKWENSSTRNEWLRKGMELVEADPEMQKLTGFEFWFTPYSKKSSGSVPLITPPRSSYSTQQKIRLLSLTTIQEKSGSKMKPYLLLAENDV